MLLCGMRLIPGCTIFIVSEENCELTQISPFWTWIRISWGDWFVKETWISVSLFRRMTLSRKIFNSSLESLSVLYELPDSTMWFGGMACQLFSEVLNSGFPSDSEMIEVFVFEVPNDSTVRFST